MKRKSPGKFRLLLTGGGTGGHLFPAMAAAEEICGRIEETDVLFVGTSRKMDKTALAGSGYRMKEIYCYGLKGKNPISVLKALAALPISFVQAAWAICRFRPDVVLGVGGYVTGPVVAAARVLGKKTVIHEQNSVPGLANRKLGSFADTVCISLPGSRKYFPAKKTILTGNPVRRRILALSGRRKESGEEKRPVLLVLGGSLGAHRVNELVAEAVTGSADLQKIKVIHQTGPADKEMIQRAYDKAGIDAEVDAFFVDMAAVYGQADLLVSRAGATTLAELAVLGKPAILIPYPYAADDHQKTNGDYYVQGGGCRMFLEKELSGSLLAEQITTLLTDKDLLENMSERMRELAMPMAAARIADICIGCEMDKGEAGNV